MNILVSDDHQLILDGIGSFLKTSYPESTIHFAKNKSTLIAELKSHSFDILLQDVRLGNDDAREFIKEIFVVQPDLKVIIVSTLFDTLTVKTLLNQGAHGYVIKVDGLEEIQQAIRAVQSGEVYLSSALQKQLIGSSLSQNTDQTEIRLTQREREVLKEILNEKSTKAIAESLFISEKTVEGYRANLFVKFDVKNVAGLVKKAIIHGFME
ncbi:MAG: LuxR C-terminal-related transcriptional regulator [Crocinitomicaceae bacterium]